MKLRERSLKFKLNLMSAGIVIGLGIAFLAISEHMVNEEEDKVLESVQGAADAVGSAISAQFYERYGDVQAFAINPDLQSANKSVVTEALNNYAVLYGIYDLILVTDDHGRIVNVNTKNPDGKDINAQALVGRSVADTAWFKNTMAGNFTADKEKGFDNTYFEDVHVDNLVSEVYGENRPGTSFSAQVKDKAGKVIGVVSNRAGSRWFELALTDGYNTIDEMGFNRGDVVAFNKQGQVIAAAEATVENAKASVNRDFNYLLKYSLADSGSEAYKSFVDAGRKHARTWGFNKKENYATAAGVAPVTGKKFIDSIGWGVIVRGPKADILASVNRVRWMTHLVLAFMTLIAIVVTTLVSNSIAGQLRRIAQSITGGTSEIDNMATQMAEASGQLSSATTEQAAALQETVSSIDEVSSMIAKNSDNAKRSQETSVTSSDAANKGKQVVGEMINSIEVINKSNLDIMKQIETGNQQIGDIVKVIEEIGTKTKVINDIVFQTKLLSFNASVEAARAGEHGKGFAVVAEEVGNLAQMSGNAAKEISTMLDGSIQKVQQIVNETRTRVDSLMKDSKSKVDAGTVTAKRCGEMLDEIVKHVADVGAMVAEIATASQEQSQGVSEINKAMNQLDQVTQQNAAAAQQAAGVADNLRNQGSNMQHLASELMATVEGRGGAAPKAAAPAPVAAKAPAAKPAPKAKEDANVLAFSKITPAKSEVTKMASGSNDAPSRDDSRFEEV